MTTSLLLLLLLAATSSSAQQKAPPAPASQPTIQPASQPVAAINDSPKIPFLAKLVARSFFSALVSGELDALAPLCGRRVNFDGTLVSTPEEIKKRLRGLIDRVSHDGLRLSRMVLLDHRDMRRHFGKPPQRIRAAIRPGQIYALGRFQWLGAVVVLQRAGRFWRVVAITD